VKVDSDVASQIESYAFAVADDERFRVVPAKWVFWAVSSDIDQNVARKVNQKDRPRGILFQDDEQRITIWVKTRSQIINDCKSRLRFFAEKLKYAPDRTLRFNTSRRPTISTSPICSHPRWKKRTTPKLLSHNRQRATAPDSAPRRAGRPGA